ncbi:MAG: PulJ/GspJ family protein [Thermodesulfobacteriota bacterium]
MQIKSGLGFTLIEMIMVIVILSTIAGLTIYFLVDSVSLYSLAVNQKALSDEARIALEKICRDLRDAQNISSPAAGSSGQILSFTRTHATAGDVSNENIIYRQVGQILEKVKTSPALVSPLAENVATFSVSRAAGNEEMKIVLTLSGSNGERVTLQTKVYPRNLSAATGFKNFLANWQER